MGAQLEGYPDPRCQNGSSGSNLALPPLTTYLNPINTVISYPIRKLASRPVSGIKMAAAARLDAAANPRDQATAHLIVMAFYFLLGVGEYTLPPAHVTTRTIQLRVCDTRFWQGQTLLPRTSDASTLAATTSVTLMIDNQKNGHRGDTIHQELRHGFLPRPVAALVSAIMAQNMPLSAPTEFCTTGYVCAARPHSSCRPAWSPISSA